ncbi:hypothetical protein LT493_40560 [Streptomyces tricolor]|nr:hypothetical protein [Streptomyces tricolor]
MLGPLAVWDDEGEPVQVPRDQGAGAVGGSARARRRPCLRGPAHRRPCGATQLPGNPAGALQAKVSQLRRVLGRERLLRQPPGYGLRLDPADEVGRGAVRPARRRGPCGRWTRGRGRTCSPRPSGWWRGPAYADFADEEFVRRRPGSAWRNSGWPCWRRRAEGAPGGRGPPAARRGAGRARGRASAAGAAARGTDAGASRRSGHQGRATLASYEDLRTRLAARAGRLPRPHAGAPCTGDAPPGTGPGHSGSGTGRGGAGSWYWGRRPPGRRTPEGVCRGGRCRASTRPGCRPPGSHTAHRRTPGASPAAAPNPGPAYGARRPAASDPGSSPGTVSPAALSQGARPPDPRAPPRRRTPACRTESPRRRPAARGRSAHRSPLVTASPSAPRPPQRRRNPRTAGAGPPAPSAPPTNLPVAAHRPHRTGGGPRSGCPGCSGGSGWSR